MNRVLLLLAAAWLTAAGAVAALPLVAAPNTALGRTLYRQCIACHGASGEGGGAGPAIRGLIGRKVASDPDFAYSAALRRSGKTWTQTELIAFLLRPQAAVPGTRMAYPGAGSPDRAAALAAHVATLR